MDYIQCVDFCWWSASTPHSPSVQLDCGSHTSHQACTLASWRFPPICNCGNPWKDCEADSAILEGIVKQTVAFANAMGAVFDIYMEELQAFLAIHTVIGLLKLPQTSDYWSTNEVTSTLWFSAVMAMDRFLTILRYHHLVDSLLQKGRWNWTWPFIQSTASSRSLCGFFSRYYQPSWELSIDEMMMIGTWYRMSFLQYMSKKPCKFGVKILVLAEAKTGYVLNV